MQAIRVHEYGDTGQLTFESVPLPEPAPGQVRIKVEATGVNFIEIYQRRGQYPLKLPLTLGAEFAGTVDALGEGVTGFQPGDRVVTAGGMGGYAEYALAPADRLIQLPASVSTRQAAAVIFQGITAHYLARSTYPIKPGDVALIHAAGGGVGQLLVHICKKFGATVIGTASSPEKAQRASQAGADHVIIYTQEDFEAAVKQLTGGKGVDVVYDGVGKDTFLKGLNCIKQRGMMVLLGWSSGPVDPVDPQLLAQKGSLYLTRPTIGHHMATRDELLWRATDLLSWLSSGELNVHIDCEFPLSEAAAAHQYMESRQTKGKLLLIP